MALTDDFCIGAFRFLQSRKMALGYHENMRGSLRIDVFEGEDMFVFVDFL